MRRRLILLASILSNPTSDPEEKTNFADQQPELIKHLKQLHETIDTQP